MNEVLGPILLDHVRTVSRARYARIPKNYAGPREFVSQLPLEYLFERHPHPTEGTEVYMVDAGRLLLIDSNVEMGAV